MKKYIFILCIIFPSFVFAQFDDKEMYIYTRLGIDIGMRDFTYSSSIGMNTGESPVISTLKLSSGITTEIGVGLMIIDHFFIEGNLGYTIVQRKGYRSENSEFYVDKYNFSRYKIGVNGVYFIDIDNYTTIFGQVGFSAIIPQQLKITTSHTVENIRYRATAGFTTGFGGNFNHNNFIYGVGLHFQMANLKVVPNQNYPKDFEELNHDFEKIKIRAMVLSFTVKYLF